MIWKEIERFPPHSPKEIQRVKYLREKEINRKLLT